MCKESGTFDGLGFLISYGSWEWTHKDCAAWRTQLVRYPQEAPFCATQLNGCATLVVERRDLGRCVLEKIMRQKELVSSDLLSATGGPRHVICDGGEITKTFFLLPSIIQRQIQMHRQRNRV